MLADDGGPSASAETAQRQTTVHSARAGRYGRIEGLFRMGCCSAAMEPGQGVDARGSKRGPAGGFVGLLLKGGAHRDRAFVGERSAARIGVEEASFVTID